MCDNSMRATIHDLSVTFIFANEKNEEVEEQIQNILIDKTLLDTEAQI